MITRVTPNRHKCPGLREVRLWMDLEVKNPKETESDSYWQNVMQEKNQTDIKHRNQGNKERPHIFRCFSPFCASQIMKPVTEDAREFNSQRPRSREAFIARTRHGLLRIRFGIQAAGFLGVSDRMQNIREVMAWEEGCLPVLHTNHGIKLNVYYFTCVWTYMILQMMWLN